MKEFVTIPATVLPKSHDLYSKQKAQKLLNVAAYCRVSGLSEEQHGSLTAQQTYYTDLINENSNWKNAGVYAETAPARNMKERTEFKKLLAKCRRGKVDVIMTKSVSRFSRNTVDALEVCKELRARDVEVVFEQEGMYLSDPATVMHLEFAFALAQEENRSKSLDIKHGIRQGLESGKSGYCNFTCYGYRKEGDTLVIDEVQAKVVRLIFGWKANGYSLGAISKELQKRKIPSPTGKETWSRETINKLLKNEKVCGNVMLQKTFVPDYLSGKQVKNNGECAKVMIKNNHVGIISVELFEQVNC